MAYTRIDGAELWFSEEVEVLETIRFIDRPYLGVITHPRSTNIFYASLMYWAVHTLHEANGHGCI
jgi:hypothetical protein